MVLYEKEICSLLRIPSIPKKKWDGKSSFEKSVAVISLMTGIDSYAVASYDSEKDDSPRIVKVFSLEPFNEIKDIFIVPQYMDVENIEDADLDEESKKRAKELADEAKEIEDEGASDELKEPENEYYFDHIHSDEEAAAYISAYNKSNKIRAKVPKTHDGLVMRLSVIYSETNRK